MTRKYRQRGYMDEDRREKQQKTRPKKKSGGEGPRSPVMPGYHEVFRCAMCGTTIPYGAGIGHADQCPKCNADLHTCKNCVYLDPGIRFECSQPIQERVPRKDQRNNCTFYTARKLVEKQTTTSVTQMANPRAAFDRLFKK